MKCAPIRWLWDDSGLQTSATFANLQITPAKDGVTVAVEAGQSYQELARNRLEATRSQPWFVGNDRILRGCENLYRIGGGR